MNFQELVSQLVIDTKGSPGSWFQATADSSVGVFMPELVICATIVLLLLLRIPRWGQNVSAFWIMLVGSCIALYFSAPWRHLSSDPVNWADPASATRMEIFTGMLVYDPFSVYIRSALLLFAVLFTLFTRLSGIPDQEDGPDIYSLVLGATLGMCLMASANHLLMVFMAVEMASVPCYALAGMLKGRRESSEAALKYAVYGAGAAGVMLYGISLIAGLLNTAHLPTLATQLAVRLPTMASEEHLTIVLAGLMIMVGLAFKLSAVPFHFWCPDVFEGASAEVNAFLSVASKAAALALLLRVAVGVGVIPPDSIEPGARTAAIERSATVLGNATATLNQIPNSEVVAASFQEAILNGQSIENSKSPTAGQDYFVSQEHFVSQLSPRDEGAQSASLSRRDKMGALEPARVFIGKLIALFAAVTCTFGNLAAYGQTNLKRLLAYSTIAHAGYMMMPVSAVMVLAGRDQVGAENAVAALALYIGVYLFMNLGAFVIVAFLRNAMRSEEISSYAGLRHSCPITAICFSLILFALIGLPPLSGFVGKFAVFGSLLNAYTVGGTSATYIFALAIVGGLNTAISLFYYLRVIKIMTMDPEPQDRPPFSFPEVSIHGAFIWLVTLPTAVLMLNWERLGEACLAAARHMFAA